MGFVNRLLSDDPLRTALWKHTLRCERAPPQRIRLRGVIATARRGEIPFSVEMAPPLP